MPRLGSVHEPAVDTSSTTQQYLGHILISSEAVDGAAPGHDSAAA